MRGVALVVAGLLFASANVQAQNSAKEPTCRADRRGEDLVTRIEFPDGYTVEGPWHVTKQGGGAAQLTLLTAVLDRIVETQPISHKKQTTLLPSAIEMKFHGATFNDVLNQAASIWCMTVLQARPAWSPEDQATPASTQLRITI